MSTQDTDYVQLVRRSVLPAIIYAEDASVSLEIPLEQAAAAMESGRFGKAAVVEGRLAVGREAFLGSILGIDPDAPESIAIDAEGVAAFLNISRAHWLRLVSAGRAPAGTKLGTSRRWSRAELSSWIEAGAPPLARWQEARR